MSAPVFYNRGRVRGLIDFASDTIKMGIVNTGYVPDVGHDAFADISANTMAQATLQNQTFSGGVFDADDPTFGAVTGTLRYVVMWKDAGPLVCYWQIADTSLADESVTLLFPAGGLFSTTYLTHFSFNYTSDSYNKSETDVIPVTIERDASIDPATVDLIITGGKEAGEDYGWGKNFTGSGTWVNTAYETSKTTVSFAAGETSKVVNVTVVNNPMCEPPRILTLTLSNPSTGSVTGGTKTITIVDDNIDLGIDDITDAPYSAVAGADCTTAIQAAIDAIKTAGGKGYIIFPGSGDTANPYVYWADPDVGIKLPPGISLIAGDTYSASIKRIYRNSVSKHLFKTATAGAGYVYASATDSNPIGIKGLVLDGNAYNTPTPNEQNFYFELGAYAGASPTYPNQGRLKVKAEKCYGLAGQTDCFSIVTNCDFELYESQSTDVRRGFVTIVGGYTKTVMRNITTSWTGNVNYPNIVFQSEYGGTGQEGYNGYTSTDIYLYNVVGNTSFDIMTNEGSTRQSTVIVDGFRQTGNLTGYSIILPDATATFNNCRFQAGSSALLRQPKNATFTNCDFIAKSDYAGVKPTQAILQSWQRTAPTPASTTAGQRLYFTNCNIIREGMTDADCLIAYSRLDIDVISRDNRVYFNGCTIQRDASGFTYGIYNNTAGGMGKFYITNTSFDMAENGYPLYLYGGSGNNAYNVSLDNMSVVRGRYMFLKFSNQAACTITFANCSVNAANNYIANAGTWGANGPILTGHRTIIGTAAPTTANNAMLNDVFTYGGNSWVCNPSPVTNRGFWNWGNVNNPVIDNAVWTAQ